MTGVLPRARRIHGALHHRRRACGQVPRSGVEECREAADVPGEGGGAEGCGAVELDADDVGAKAEQQPHHRRVALGRRRVQRVASLDERAVDDGARLEQKPHVVQVAVDAAGEEGGADDAAGCGVPERLHQRVGRRLVLQQQLRDVRVPARRRRVERRAARVACRVHGRARREEEADDGRAGGAAARAQQRRDAVPRPHVDVRPASQQHLDHARVAAVGGDVQR
mmetsp:Transcript_7376/g.19155  ORF Transcript_7376/g.19155 Transcript_7376/m.19155 type:complete len:224 (-) Transcript_7376:364-1035(-)